MSTNSVERGVLGKTKRTSRTQADTMAIDVANISDDIYFDRRNLRDSLNNKSNSFSTSSGSSSSASRNPSSSSYIHNNSRLPSSNSRLDSSSSNNNSNNNTSRSPPPPPPVQQDQITVDIPNFRDVVVRTSDNSAELLVAANHVNKNYVKKSTWDGSHLDWDGDGDTIASGLSSFKGAAIIVHHGEGDEGGRRREEGPSSSNQSRRLSLGLDMPTLSKVSRKSSRKFESIWGDMGNTTDEDSVYSNSAGSKDRKSALKNCVYGVKSHGKMVLCCIAISLVLSVAIGVIIAMIPMWIQSEERGESAEVGGLVYGEGDGVLMDSSSSGTATKFVLTSPPYNLDYICKQDTLLEEGGYDKCVAACFPSRCCLLDESQTYEVWALHIGANDEIGKSISSCFNDHKDACIRYNQACSVLGKESLLPIKPPSSKEVLAMNNVEKLHLAETIIRACAPRVEGSTDGLAECQSLCEAKSCCFVEDIDEDETVRITDSGASSILDIPTNLEEGSTKSEDSGRKIQSTEYCGDDPQQFCLTYAGCETYFK